MTFSNCLEKAGRIDIGLYLLKSVGLSALKTGITLATLRDSGNTPVDNERLIIDHYKGLNNISLCLSQ